MFVLIIVCLIISSFSAFGVFYAFDKPYLTVAVGDYVQWTWKTPVFVNNVAHGIYEVSSPSSTMPKVGGFNSGPPTPDGNSQIF
ncbi:hypothetical protein DPMN_079580 [Dreissena polymorpha]|uniref:Uncharacterized protein n=1 Tax=Dreissena polymorpha TaxID=45954 RepID=A0A9D4BQ71_DREPO|nr:hypothetical protein DPMN_079580 [Dreissena polymorpha]